MSHFLFGALMFCTSLFLILLVLVQRGRGGGLAGAFGGMGGQSAFGTKAGDLFTKLTMGVATFWILLCVLAIMVLNQPSTPLGDGAGGSVFDGASEEPLPGTGLSGTGLSGTGSADSPLDSGAEEGDTSGTGGLGAAPPETEADNGAEAATESDE